MGDKKSLNVELTYDTIISGYIAANDELYAECIRGSY